jgi:serine/threonine-protein kinase RsbW
VSRSWRVLKISSNEAGNGVAPLKSFELPGTPEAAFAARRELLAVNGVLPARLRDDLLLLVTELVTNAVRHAGCPPHQGLRVELVLGAEVIRVAVRDRGGRFRRAAPCPDPDGAGGWGLFLVDRLADRWAIETSAKGTCVWFEIGYAK